MSFFKRKQIFGKIYNLEKIEFFNSSKIMKEYLYFYVCMQCLLYNNVFLFILFFGKMNNYTTMKSYNVTVFIKYRALHFSFVSMVVALTRQNLKLCTY